MGIRNSLASQICGAIVVSSHCSRSLASSAFTPFQSPAASLLRAHSFLPSQLRGVTNTNVHSARSAEEIVLRRAW